MQSIKKFLFIDFANEENGEEGLKALAYYINRNTFA